MNKIGKRRLELNGARYANDVTLFAVKKKTQNLYETLLRRLV